jgi:pimeloyl-ACP methyl ester carboxylesterase
MPAVPEGGVHDGLSWAAELPAEPPAGGVVVLHGAGSTKDGHRDFARRCAARGLAALAFDLRGHGRSAGALDGRVLDDVAAMAGLLAELAGAPGRLPIALRGSSMGGYLALVAAAPVRARAVVAVCPASGAGLRRSLRDGRLSFAADAPALEALLAQHDERAAAAALGPRLLLMHAEGDDVVPVERSRALHAAAPGSELVVLPGGHHRSVQHDPDLQERSVRFLLERLGR